MRRLALLMLFATAAAHAAAPAPSPVEVLVIGTFHLDNPGQDVVNSKIDSVLTPAKQAQLDELVGRVAAFRPTAIALERVAADPATLIDQKFAAFTPADLATDADERVQIAYRLARRQGLTRVYAIDEQEGPGEPSYFPFDKVDAWARANGRSADLDAMFATARAVAAKRETDQKTKSLTTLIAEANDPATLDGARGHSEIYMRFMTFGAGRDWPGAELNGRWYTRNAKIFAKLLKVAKPGDRIVVLFGSGHGYWLRTLVGTMPGYRLADTLKVLRTPARR